MSFNPAMVADDAIVIYNAIKNKKKRKELKQQIEEEDAKDGEVTEPKTAGLCSSRTAGLCSSKTAGLCSSKTAGLCSSKTAGLCSSKTAGLSNKTLALTAAGLISSAVAPEDFLGPGEGESRFDPKRAIKSVALYNTVGRSLVSIPGNAARAAEAIKSRQAKAIALNLALLSPGIGAAVPIVAAAMHKEKPELKDIRRGAAIGAIPVLPLAIKEGYRMSKVLDRVLDI